MATFCPTCIAAACDHCRWYDFNGDEGACYTGDGWCRRHGCPSDPTDECGDFHCNSATDDNGTPTPEHGLAALRARRRGAPQSGPTA
jgi:hypothetical protein